MCVWCGEVGSRGNLPEQRSCLFIWRAWPQSWHLHANLHSCVHVTASPLPWILSQSASQPAMVQSINQQSP